MKKYLTSKNVITFILVVFLVSLSIPGYGAKERKIAPIEKSRPEISFSEGSWKGLSYKQSQNTKVSIEEEIRHSKNKGLRITNGTADYVSYWKELELTPNTDYRITCWVKTEKVGLSETGACIFAEGKNIATTDETYICPLSNNEKSTLSFIESKETEYGPRHVCSADLTGENRLWQKLQLHIRTSEEDTKIKLGVELGRPGKENTGTAYFSDMTILKENPVTLIHTSIALQVASIFSFLLVLYMVFSKEKEKRIEKKKYKDKDKDMGEGSNPSHRKWYLIGLFGIAFLLRVLLAVSIEGHLLDMYCFTAWASAAAEGISRVYQRGIFLDYPPLYVSILSVIGLVGKELNLYVSPISFAFLLKLPSILAEMTIGYLLYRVAKDRLPFQKMMIILGLYLFGSVFLLDTCLWGQVDSFLTLLIVSALLLLHYEKYEWSSLVIALAILTKPQGIIFAPIWFFALLRHKNWKTFITCIFVGIATIALVVLPFSLQAADPLWVFKLYRNTLTEYTTAVQGAYNLFGLLGGVGREDSEILFLVSYRVWGGIFIILSTLLAGYLYFKDKGRYTSILAATVLYTAVFMLSSRIHERYLILAMPLYLLLYILSEERGFLLIFGLFSMTLFWSIDSNFSRIFVPNIQVMSFINLMIFGWMIWIVIKMVNKKDSI